MGWHTPNQNLTSKLNKATSVTQKKDIKTKMSEAIKETNVIHFASQQRIEGNMIS